MSYAIYNLRGGNYGRKSSDSREFEEAMDMAKEGLERVCELAEEMREQYGERRSYGSYGSRGGYGRRGDYSRRDDEMWDDDEMYGMRRRRDSRGRYM